MRVHQDRRSSASVLPPGEIRERLMQVQILCTVQSTPRLANLRLFDLRRRRRRCCKETNPGKLLFKTGTLKISCGDLMTYRRVLSWL